MVLSEMAPVVPDDAAPSGTPVTVARGPAPPIRRERSWTCPASIWFALASCSFCRVTWSRRCSILRRRSSSSWWASEGKTAARGRASTGGTEGDPSCPMAPAHQPANVQHRITIQIQRSLKDSMLRVIWIPTCPNDREDRHRSGQVPDGRRTTIGVTPRAWKTVEDVRPCFTAWMIQFASRRASWEATAILDPLSNQTELLAKGPWPAVAKADMFAAIPLVILRLLQAFLHNLA